MAVLDLFSLLVINIFGSIMMATVFMVVAFWVLGGWFGKMGPLPLTVISGLYFMIVITAAYGGVTGALMFLGASIYFVTAILPWIGGMWNR